MNKILILAVISLFIFSCKKEPSTFPIKGTGLIGRWQLIESSLFVNSVQEPWKTVSANSRSIISFKSDSSFTYDNNFPFKEWKYDHFKTVHNNTDAYIFLYSATYNPEYAGTSVKFTNDNEIIISQSYIDTREDEKFIRVN